MNPDAAAVLRRAAAHVLVADVAAPALDDDTTHHLFRVLRVRDGDTVTVTDGQGSWRRCVARADTIMVDGEVEMVARRPDPLTVAVAIPKQDRPEWIVQKLTEIGIDRVVFLHSERSVVRWDADRASKHLTKLRRVAAEALQQSRGVWLPSVAGPVAASEFLGDALVAEPGARPLTAGDHTVAIGPEGGWSALEVARAAGGVSIGSRVLRVETAAIVTASRLVLHAP